MNESDDRTVNHVNTLVDIQHKYTIHAEIHLHGFFNLNSCRFSEINKIPRSLDMLKDLIHCDQNLAAALPKFLLQGEVPKLVYRKTLNIFMVLVMHTQFIQNPKKSVKFRNIHVLVHI